MRLFLPLLLAATCAAQEMPALPAAALPAGAAEAVLPAGAIAHVRLAGLAQVLDALDRLVVPFVPAHALPPDLRGFLAQPRPLLAFLGANAVGQPLTPALVAQLTGIAPDRPATLTFYAAAPDEGFVLALPIADRVALAGLLLNLTAPRALQAFDLHGAPALAITVGNPDLPSHLVALTSADTLYLAGSPQVAAMLAADAPRLATAPAVARTLAEHATADLALTLDTSLLKGFLRQAQRSYATIPPAAIADVRAALASLDPRLRAQIDLRLRLQFGIALEPLVDYAECVLVGTYETLFAAVVREALALDGVALALDLGEHQQRVSLTVWSATIDPARWPQPIPRGPASAGIALLPGGRDLIALAGRDPAPEGGALGKVVVANIVAKLAAKRMPPAFAERLTRLAAAQTAVPTLAMRVPWLVETELATAPMPAPADAPGLGAWFGAVGSWLGSVAATRVTLLPGADAAPVEAHLRASAAAADANAAAWTAFSTPLFGEPFADSVHRVQTGAMADGVGTLVSEDAWITRAGFLGYDQHELVNRRFVRWRPFAGHLLVQHGGRDHRWLAALAAQPRPLPPALAELLALPPEDASAVACARQLHRVVDLVDTLVAVEALARRELDTYLAAAGELERRHADDPESLAVALAGLEMPLLVRALERDRDGRLGCRLPGDLRYPRPAVMPLVRGLFADYARQADGLGGAVAWQRIAAGRAEWTLVQRTDALATLVRTVGDALWGRHLNDRRGMQVLERTLTVRGDGRRYGGEVLATNQLWAAFE